MSQKIKSTATVRDMVKMREHQLERQNGIEKNIHCNYNTIQGLK